MMVDDRTMAFSRLYAHPRERVWQAWTDPTEIGKWWGPNGFTTTTREMNVAPGGVWLFTMHSPEGQDYQNRVAYREVVKPVRLVYDHSDDLVPPQIQFHVTVEFIEESPGSTRLEMKSVFDSAELLRRLKEEVGAEEGGRQTLERLAEYLEATS